MLLYDVTRPLNKWVNRILPSCWPCYFYNFIYFLNKTRGNKPRGTLWIQWWKQTSQISTLRNVRLSFQKWTSIKYIRNIHMWIWLFHISCVTFSQLCKLLWSIWLQLHQCLSATISLQTNASMGVMGLQNPETICCLGRSRVPSCSVLILKSQSHLEIYDHYGYLPVLFLYRIK